MSQVAFKCKCGTIFSLAYVEDGMAKCPECRHVTDASVAGMAYLGHLRDLVAKGPK